ncbi:Spc24 subunit of Ndc80-domain-containing protein [Halenospora varia]|nr:Spc24 subunit of Ndc80-domain-containing protein [Halenospora varia]
MLLDEDPATLIHHTIGNFNITPDKLAVARINESLSTLQQARDLRVREAESALKKLARTHSTLSSHHQETLSSHSPSAHSSLISSLDTQKFRIAKSASDLEIESERLSSHLSDLQARLQELEVQGNEGGEFRGRGLGDDEVALRLKVYRGLGMDVEKDGDGNGREGDVRIVNLDGRQSRFFYANHFWKIV